MPPRALALYFGRDVAPALRVSYPIDEKRLVGVLATDDPEELFLRLAESEISRQNAILERDHALGRGGELESELAVLRSSMLGQAAEAAKRCPPIGEAFRQYERHMRRARRPRTPSR